ncbi:MAG: flagellar export chaperone FliS [Planctomycetaceae bacterium]|nr:flagellar export chaperone FliS [Planctomycetaceae bacterium]
MNAAEVYQETSVTTQTKGRLVVMLYDGAISYLHKAQQCIRQADLAGKNQAISKSRDIIHELNMSLNMDEGGPVANNLRTLYNFIWRYLADANIKNDPQILQKVINMLSELGQAWRKIAS